MKICEIFYSIQGEVDIGMPSIFVRTAGCNMTPKCKFCDSIYSWEDSDTEMSIEVVVEKIKKFNCNNIVFTGGEPTLQIKDITKLKKELGEEYNFFLESNGLTFLDFEEIKMFKKISISPKKQNYSSVCLTRYSVFPFCRFKFVYEGKEEKWWEKVITENMLPKDQIFIMAEGKTKEEQEKLMPKVIEYCKIKGYNFTPRLHTLVWGNKRAV